MRDWVSEWVPEGRLWVWRYAEPRHDWRGWHWSGDPAGCRSIRNLLDRMRGGDACHRTLQLEPVTESVLRMPNYGRKCLGQFSRLRVQFEPEHGDLTLDPDESRLVLIVGNQRIGKLASALASVEAGHGDFGIRFSDNKRVDPWMFWWPPRQDS